MTSSLVLRRYGKNIEKCKRKKKLNKLGKTHITWKFDFEGFTVK